MGEKFRARGLGKLWGKKRHKTQSWPLKAGVWLCWPCQHPVLSVWGSSSPALISTNSWLAPVACDSGLGSPSPITWPTLDSPESLPWPTLRGRSCGMALFKAKGTEQFCLSPSGYSYRTRIWILLHQITSSSLQMFNCILPWGMCRGVPFLSFCSAACQVASVLSDSVRPHGLQPTRLLHPWDFPGNSTGVGCHCLLPPFALVLLNFQSSALSQPHMSPPDSSSDSAFLPCLMWPMSQ